MENCFKLCVYVRLLFLDNFGMEQVSTPPIWISTPYDGVLKPKPVV